MRHMRAVLVYTVLAFLTSDVFAGNDTEFGVPPGMNISKMKLSAKKEYVVLLTTSGTGCVSVQPLISCLRKAYGDSLKRAYSTALKSHVAEPQLTVITAEYGPFTLEKAKEIVAEMRKKVAEADNERWKKENAETEKAKARTKKDTVASDALLGTKDEQPKLKKKEGDRVGDE